MTQHQLGLALAVAPDPDTHTQTDTRGGDLWRLTAGRQAGGRVYSRHIPGTSWTHHVTPGRRPVGEGGGQSC